MFCEKVTLIVAFLIYLDSDMAAERRLRKSTRPTDGITIENILTWSEAEGKYL